MPVPTNLSDLSTTPASNSPASTDTLSTTDDYLRALSAILAKVGDGTNALVSPSFTTSVVAASTTFAVFNATATTINAFGAATTLNIGNAAGATALLGTLNVVGNFSVATSKLTVNASTGAAVFAGAVSGITTLGVSGLVTGTQAGDAYFFKGVRTGGATVALYADTTKAYVGSSTNHTLAFMVNGTEVASVAAAGAFTAGAISGTTGSFSGKITSRTAATTIFSFSSANAGYNFGTWYKADGATALGYLGGGGGSAVGGGTVNDFAVRSEGDLLLAAGGDAIKATLSSTGLSVTGTLGVSGISSFSSAVEIKADGAAGIAANAYLNFQNLAATRQWIMQLDASNGLAFWYYNGSSWALKKTLDTSGAWV